jgi:hypothetical protein
VPHQLHECSTCFGLLSFLRDLQQSSIKDLFHHVCHRTRERLGTSSGMVTFHDVLSTRCRLLLGHPPVDPPRLLHLLPPLGTFKKLHYELGLSGPVIEHATDVLHIGLVLAIREYSSRATVLETRPVVVRLPPRPLVRIPVRGGQQRAVSRWSPGVLMLQYRVVTNRYPPLDYPPYPAYPIQGTFEALAGQSTFRHSGRCRATQKRPQCIQFTTQTKEIAGTHRVGS